MTKVEDAVSTDTKVTPAIPVVNRTDAPSHSGSNLLKRFGGLGKVQPKAKAKETREELVLTPEAKQLMLTFAPLKELKDVFEERAKVEGAALNAELMKLYVEAMWKGKGQPQNPAIKVCVKDENGKEDPKKVDASGTFIVQEKFKINLPSLDGEEDPEHVAIQTLIDLGVEKLDAKNLVNSELDFTPEISLDFTAQLHGKKVNKAFVAPNDLQKRATEKLFMYLLGESDTLDLNPDERGAINVDRKFNIEVKPGFLQRVVSYCHCKDHLTAIFQVVAPTFYVKGAKIGVSDALDEKNKRLQKVVKDILG